MQQLESSTHPQSAATWANLHEKIDRKRMKVQASRGGCSVAMASQVPSAFLLLAAVLLAHATARADACRIEASGTDSAEWSAATASLDELALTDRDCVRVRIDITADQARVVFTTADGRRAERIVTTPADLRPTINALRVQGPDAAAPQAAAATEPSPPPAPRRSNYTGLRLALLTGVRGGAESLVSPLLTGEVSFGWRRLELGASLSAEVQYFDMTGQRSPDRESGAAVLAANGGIRQPSGSFDLRAGGRVAYALLLSVDSEARACPLGEICPFPGYDERSGEWRLGAYVGFAVPRSSMLRFRTELATDFALPPANDGVLPLTPPWALCLLLGIEVAP
jgi:hypothetical protein